MNTNTINRFWSKVNKTKDCWEWTASRRHKGYGAFVWADDDGNVIHGRAHRFSYELHYGKIPDNLCVLHKCDNPKCVNPEHLFLGTKADNNHDMIAKGRRIVGGKKTDPSLCKYERGESHHAAKLNESIIREIRNDRTNGLSFGDLSKKYGLSIGYVFRVCNKIAWKHVE